jgi:hypothetical protein
VHASQKVVFRRPCRCERSGGLKLIAGPQGPKVQVAARLRMNIDEVNRTGSRCGQDAMVT